MKITKLIILIFCTNLSYAHPGKDNGACDIDISDLHQVNNSNLKNKIKILEFDIEEKDPNKKNKHGFKKKEYTFKKGRFSKKQTLYRGIFGLSRRVKFKKNGKKYKIKEELKFDICVNEPTWVSEPYTTHRKSHIMNIFEMDDNTVLLQIMDESIQPNHQGTIHAGEGGD